MQHERGIKKPTHSKSHSKHHSTKVNVHRKISANIPYAQKQMLSLKPSINFDKLLFEKSNALEELDFIDNAASITMIEKEAGFFSSGAFESSLCSFEENSSEE